GTDSAMRTNGIDCRGADDSLVIAPTSGNNVQTLTVTNESLQAMRNWSIMNRGPLGVTLLLGLAGVVAAGRLAPAQEFPQAVGTWKATGKNGAVAAGGQEAVDAGLAMLKAGGNAADAAVVTTLIMTVTDAPLVAFGGE